jgi:prepilin-type N-terminal cleavage/methylation domain-containing protein
MQKGFTIIELLVIVVVIGILLSIGIVSYNGYQNRANDASVQSDLESIAGELEAYRVRVSGWNPNSEFPDNPTELESTEIQASKNAYDTTVAYNMIYCVATTGTDAYQAYKLVARSKSGTIFMMTQDGFTSHALTASSMTAALCPALGMTLGSSGMASGGTWQAWVRSS